MKLKDTDYLYATMRVRANEKSLLSAQKIDRMIDAKTPEEAGKILTESGYGEISARSFSAVELVLKKMQADTMALIEEVCENKYIPEVFA
ncbi:MAG: V-type ATPase subunit, partial [Oscillospiraceae bacterium]|nr:V-type ATPase subunit [Oscillospiraceae bacterium]